MEQQELKIKNTINKNEKLIEINLNTNFTHIMENCNFESKIYKIGKNFKYFKVKIKGKFITLIDGDSIIIDNNYNLIKIIKSIC